MKKFLVFLIIFYLFIPTLVFAEEDSTFASNAKSAIMVEASTGKIIFEKNSHEKLAPASMTKMMSMLLILEAIENELIKWDDIITVSERASSMGGSQILLETGEEMSVSDLFKGVAVASGNDAVVALAETVSGSVEEFVDLMNKRAKELGMNDTNFKNPHGLDDANHYSSAYDMMLVARELAKHEKLFEYTSIYEDYLRKGTDKELWLVNTNKLVRFYKGADGLKTGYTSTAGYCLTATAKKDNMRLITVVMGESDSSTRNSEVMSLFDYGFAKYKIDKIASKEQVISKIPIEKAHDLYALVVPVEDIDIFNKKTTKLGEITYDLKLNKLKAPISKGEVIGKISVLNDGVKIKDIDITVKDDIKKANIFELYLRYLKDILSGNISIN